MIVDNISSIRRRIACACGRSGRDPSAVTLVCVSKYRTPEEIAEAVRAGAADIGENRVQEARMKFPGLAAASRPRFHLVGHLQTNKAAEAVKIFDLIHSVDSVRLAREIGIQAQRSGKVQDILAQVNVSGEKSKYGLTPEGLRDCLMDIDGTPGVRLCGLMTIAPLTADQEEARPCFKGLAELLGEVNRTHGKDLRVLSMGMTNDFEVAVEEGATIVRLGRAVFEG
ncbi:MAG: YggS family pyridoxal phosphate-dependent enzyme [Deltaproteobacteria bacterium]